MFAFSRDQLRSFAPLADPALIEVLVAGADEIERAEITTPLRFQHFISQVAVETGGIKAIEENLSYSAERLVAVWPNRFPTVAAAKPYARNPQKLAGKVYAGRLGNLSAKEAWDFRGSGMLQTTGRFNFTKAGYQNNPDALRTPGPALTAALKFWVDNDCNAFADRDDLTGLRRRINGGTHGLAEARNYLAKAKRTFIGVAISAGPELTEARIRALQTQLVALGYVGLGRPDGRIGGMTIGAISSFQAENGLTVNGRFDEATQAHLFEAAPRQVARSSEKPDASRILKSAGALKQGAVGLMGVAGISSAADPLSQIEGVKGLYDRAKALLAPFSGAEAWIADHWYLAAAAVAFAVYVYGKRISDARIEDHLSGASA